MLSILLFTLYYHFFQSKNLVFPFKKLTIEYLNESKTISDFIDFNMYTNISMGTPQKRVGHFITKSDKSFYYDTLQLQYHASSEYERIQKEIENSIDIYYYSPNSTSIDEIDDYYGFYSEYYYMYDLDQNEKTGTINFNMLPNEKELKLYGTFDLYYSKREPHSMDNLYIFTMLKERGFIDGYYFTFVYGEYDLQYKFNYLNDDYSNILGNLILGESPHQFSPDKYKEEDEIKINGIFALDINEIKFKSPKLDFSETDVKLSIKFASDFFKASIGYKNATDKIFFDELIEEGLCRIDYVNENIYISSDIVYSCENNNIVKEKIKSFPNLYFEMKPYNLTFLFNYNELFKLHNNRLYFLIIYKNSIFNSWEVGELFLRKYMTSFNFDSKTISFYKSQVDDINEKTDKPIPDEDPDEEESEEESKKESEEESKEESSEEKERENEEKTEEESSKEKENEEETEEKSNGGNPDGKINIWVVIGIVGGVILIVAFVVIIVLVMKLKKFRKKKANELMDDDYEYSPKNNLN